MRTSRAVRDVWRQRAHLVRQQTANVLSLQNIIVRNTDVRRSAKRIHALTLEELGRLLPAPKHVPAVTSSLTEVHCLAHQINTLNKRVHTRLKHPPASEQLQTVEGLGTILAQTIVLETGDMRRFPTVGHYASYGRFVPTSPRARGPPTGWWGLATSLLCF